MMLMEHLWIAKAFVQKAVSATGTIGAYHLAQRIAGGLRNFQPKGRIEYAGMIAADVGLERLDGATVVEVGTGWVPVIPIGLSLLGAKRILSYDLTAHLLRDVAMQSLAQMPECLPAVAEISGAPLDVLTARLSRLCAAKDFDTLADRMGFEYFAPADMATSTATDVDLVYSNLVFEHVTPAALMSIIEHSRRILKSGGIAWHHVDYSDHYAHTFKDLSLINFLRYGERTWNAIGQSDLHYQNRLRKSDYVRAFKVGGFEVVRAIDHFGISEARARRAPLAEPFSRCEISDLTCTSSRFVLKLGSDR
jgi:SAM-dependent methyltransferase